MNSAAAQPPVDLVFTYVDGNDPAYAQQRRRCRSEVPGGTSADNVLDPGDVDIRFRNAGEITFSVNSVLKYLPWIRTIVIVTETDHPPVPAPLIQAGRIRIVHPEAFIPSRYLPTFSSNVLESFLHRIEGLSEIFIYNNDDYMHFAPVQPDFFFTTGMDGSTALALHAYPAIYRHMMHRFSRKFPSYRTNLHTLLISNAYALLRRSRPSLSRMAIIAPVHATKLWRRSTALRIDEEFGGMLEETRRRKFRDARDISYYTILYSMEKKWHPENRLHLHFFGSLHAPNAMFNFSAFSVFGNKNILWKRVLRSQARLVCLNNIPPDEREQFAAIMQKKGLSDPAPPKERCDNR